MKSVLVPLAQGSEDLEAVAFQPFLKMRQQVHVLEGATAQADSIQLRPLAQEIGQARKHLDQSIVKPLANPAHRRV